MSKDESRNDRLTLRKTNEEVLRKKLQLEAEQACREETKAFGDCAKREGLWVVLNCRKENAAMSACLDKRCTEQDFHNLLIREGIDPARLQRKSN